MWRWLILMLSLFGSEAAAGAWAREEGEVFVAAGVNFWLSDGARLPVHYDPTVYAEYGLSDRVTVGLDLHTADAGNIRSGFVFAQIPIGGTDRKFRHAVGLGFGLRADSNAATETLLRASYSWGQGLTKGWLAVDGSVTYAFRDHVFRPKVDATWGHNWADNWTTTLQLQTGQGFTNDFYAKVSPVVIYHWNDNLSVSLGAVQALTGDKGFGLKLESWLRY